MKHHPLIIAGAIFLSACSPSQPTAMDHSGMGNDMMRDDAAEPSVDASTLPLATPTEIVEVKNGDSITLTPTRVRKIIGGKEFALYGYNGMVPGPMIRATQGSTITVDVRNDIDMETTIHWHGVRLRNENDGVPGVTQEPIAPGGSHRYTVTLPDEGIYWYHPHVREDIQQDLGLYANLFVNSKNPDAYAPVNDEAFLMLDDLLLDRKGRNVPYGAKDPNFALMGRFGNLLLINGAPAKEYALTTQRGAVVRFYLTNVSNTRTFRIRIDGGRMKLVGSDVGRYEHERWIDTVTIAPAERYIVDVLFEDDGRYRISHEPPGDVFTMGSVTVTPEEPAVSYEEEFTTLRSNDDVIADIDRYRKYFDAAPDKTLELDIEMHGMNHGMMMGTDDPSGIEWEDNRMNAMMGGGMLKWKMVDADTNDENMDIRWEFKRGDVVKVRLVNKEDSPHPMQHPIHLHGQRFLVLSVNGRPNENLVWKDTVLVPKGATVDILLEATNPGDWMMHCHIAEHLSDGMMGLFSVE